MIEKNGQIHLQVERDANPVITLDSSNIIGDLQEDGINSGERYNRVLARYFDVNARAESTVIYPELDEHNRLVSLDNQVVSQGEFKFESVTDPKQIANLLKTHLLVSRDCSGMTVKVQGEAALLDPMDVVNIDYPEMNLFFNEFIVEEVHPNLELGTATIKLRAYDYRYYPFESNRTDPPAPPRDEPERERGAIENITIKPIAGDDNFERMKISWEYVGDYTPTYEVAILTDEEDQDSLLFSQHTELEQVITPAVSKGEYLLEISAIDRLGTQVAELVMTFNSEAPLPPASVQVDVTHDTVRMTPDVGIAQNVDFEYWWNTTDDVEGAWLVGKGRTYEKAGLRSETDYYYWVYTVSGFGRSDTPVAGSARTDSLPDELVPEGQIREFRYMNAREQPDKPPAQPTPSGWSLFPREGAHLTWVISAWKYNNTGELVEGEEWSIPERWGGDGSHTWVVYATSPTGADISLTPKQTSIFGWGIVTISLTQSRT